MVERRPREFAVRTALGALPDSLVAKTIGRALGVTTAAMAVGSDRRRPCSRPHSAIPAHLDRRDWSAWVLTVLIVLACTAIAAAGPARLAGRADPAKVLRHD